MITTERGTYPNGQTFYRVLMGKECLGIFGEVEGGYQVNRTTHAEPQDAVFATLEHFIQRKRREISAEQDVLECAMEERKKIKRHR